MSISTSHTLLPPTIFTDTFPIPLPCTFLIISQRTLSSYPPLSPSFTLSPYYSPYFALYSLFYPLLLPFLIFLPLPSLPTLSPYPLSLPSLPTLSPYPLSLPSLPTLSLTLTPPSPHPIPYPLSLPSFPSFSHFIFPTCIIFLPYFQRRHICVSL